MIKTHGLTHLALSVRDPERSFQFYREVLGVVAVYRQPDFIQAQTPGSRDVLVFERGSKEIGRSGGIAHFGFRLVEPGDIDKAARCVEKSGGRILSRGEFCPGEPYMFFKDLDGYEVEIWHELPTPVDPAGPRRHRTRRPSSAKRRRLATKRP
ncbi:MAG TPA: VOC family protein [Candidatus Polarisedimenticolia bacterium]|nr:VOC family protein [Candidatus Polarisedimenticolia bacterium]